MKSTKTLKNKLIIGSTAGMILVGSLIQTYAQDPLLSFEERRKLQQFPDLTVQSVLSTEFMKDLELYLADSFPFRNAFRKLKLQIASNVFNKKDQDGYFFYNGHVSKLDDSVNEDQVLLGAEKINALYEKYLKDMKVHYAIIPDKNHYLLEGTDYPKMDYQLLDQLMTDHVSGPEKILLEDVLELKDYYFTDPHWKQENLEDVIERLGDAFGFNIQMENFKVEDWRDFYGAYSSHAQNTSTPDILRYLVSKDLLSSQIYTVDTESYSMIYTPEANVQMDPYSYFAGGPAAIQIIEKNQASTGEELIIFRDSFGSSLAPILMEHYDRITLIDLRYISSDLLDEYVAFGDQDVLFLYSTGVLNQSVMLR